MSSDQDEDEPKPSTDPSAVSTSMAYLPFEVIVDILARLPVKALLRLRVVCKPWRSLIDSLDFVHLHLRKSFAAKANLTLLLRKGSRLFAADFAADAAAADAAAADAAELPHPLMCYSNEIKILGFCDGLLCLCNVAEDIAIWNPATRTHRLLPYLPSDRNRDASPLAIRGPRVYGFGCDAASDDYKLVRVSQFIGMDYRSFESEVRVYSVRAKEWKSLPDMPYALLYTKKMGVHVNGLLHWVVLRRIEVDEAGLVVAIDSAAETYREVPLPEGLRQWDQLDLGVLDGRLSFVAGYKESGFEVWVMREYGVGESWTKLVTLCDESFRSVKLVRPLTYSKSGCEILFEQDHRKLFWYDLTSQRVNNVGVRAAPEVFEALVCVNSLAPVDARSRRRGFRNSKSMDSKNKRRDNFLSQGFNLVL